MVNKTFKELNQDGHIDIQIKKAGLSLALLFSKEMLSRFDLEYDDIIRLDLAEIIKKTS